MATTPAAAQLALTGPPVTLGPLPSVLDAFAGPGGWDVGAAIIGMKPASILGVEINAHAAAAATAAGHRRMIADVASLNPAHFPHITGFIASSPCPTFSPAGLRSGVTDMQIILDVITHAGSVECDCPWEVIAEELAAASDPRTALAAQMIRFALGLPNLEWLAFEQVPAALFMFEDIAAELMDSFEGVDVFTLDAAHLGMPMRRNRVFLVANRYRPVGCQDHYPPMVRWPQRSMAEVMGWPADEMIRTRGNRRATGGNLFPASKTGWCMTEKARTWIQESTGERLTAAEAGYLQGFSLDYPWSGSRTAQFHQLADVVIPASAAAVLATASNRTWSAATAAYLGNLYDQPTPAAATA